MKRTASLTNIVLWGLIIISALLCVVIIATIESEAKPGAVAEKWISVSLYWSIGLCAIGGLLAIVFAVIQLLENRKKAMTSILFLSIFLLVLAVSYVISSSKLPNFFGVEKFIENGSLTPLTSKLIGAGLISTYLLFAIAVVAVVVFGILNSLRRS
jgi:hypothetical protein